MAKARRGFGIDVGGSGIKGAPVDLKTGDFLGERLRIETPSGAKPDDVIKVMKQIIKHFAVPEDAPIGVSFPAPIIGGKIPFMANLDKSWEGMKVTKVLTKELKRPVRVVNDADAAGFAEVRLGAAHGHEGTILVLTLGTGIGSALVANGTLVPNTELGHLLLPNGMEAEHYASSGVFEREQLSYPEWAGRLQAAFDMYEHLFSPDLFIVGGGISKKHAEFVPLISTRAPIVPAELRNSAGIVGAALLAAEANQ